MSKLLPVLAALGGVWFLPLAADAQGQGGGGGGPERCVLRIQANPTAWTIQGYDPFAGAAAGGSFDAVFRNDGGRECRFFPVLQLDQEAFGLRAEYTTRLPYTVVDTFSNADLTPTAGRTPRLVGRREVVVAPGGQQLVRFAFSVGTETLPGDGLFSQKVFLEAEASNRDVLASQPLTLALDVKPSALVGLSGAFTRTEGGARVNLGELTEGTPNIPLALYVMSTRGYRLGVESQNQGRLRLGATGWSVPYGLAVNGSSVTLAGSQTVSFPAAPGLRRENLPIAFTVGDASQRRAGTYTDVITVSIAPL